MDPFDWAWWAREEEEHPVSKPSTDLTNLLKQSVERTGSNSSIESITRSPSLLQQITVNVQAYQAHRVERSVYSLQPTVEADLVIDIDLSTLQPTVGVGSQRIDLQAYI